MNCVAAFGEPLNESSASATAALREGVRERRRSEWSIPFVRSLTKQTARKACPFGVAAKSSAHRVALFDIVDTATTCVVRLVIIPILSATRSAEDLFRGSLAPVSDPTVGEESGNQTYCQAYWRPDSNNGYDCSTFRPCGRNRLIAPDRTMPPIHPSAPDSGTARR
jgi:hypothetical protein